MIDFFCYFSVESDKMWNNMRFEIFDLRKLCTAMIVVSLYSSFAASCFAFVMYCNSEGLNEMIKLWL